MSLRKDELKISKDKRCKAKKKLILNNRNIIYLLFHYEKTHQRGKNYVNKQLKDKDEMNLQILGLLCEENNREKLEELLAENLHLINTKSKDSMTLLGRAVKYNHNEIADFLIGLGADVNETNRVHYLI